LTKYSITKHEELLRIGSSLERGTTHKLSEPFIDSILGTLDFFGASTEELQQAIIDLKFAKFKIFDFLGMMYSSKYYQAKPIYTAIEKLVDLYIAQSHVGGFAWFLRGHDLEIEEPHTCKDCIKSYDEYTNQTPEQRLEAEEQLEKIFGGNLQ